MKRFQVSLLSLLLACTLVSIGSSFYAQSDRKDLSIKIVEDDIDSVLFHVSITNISDEPIRLWEEWNTWGYFSLSFELFDMTGKSLGHIAKSQRRWTINYPSFVEINPGQSHEIEVTLHPSVWDFPDKSLLNNKGAAEYRLVASYTVQNCEESHQHAVWTGSLHTHSIAFMRKKWLKTFPKPSRASNTRDNNAMNPSRVSRRF